SPGGKALQNVFRATARGQHQHRNEVPHFPQLTNYCKSIFSREHYIKHNRIERGSRAVTQKLNGGFAIPGNFDGMTFCLKVEAQSLGQMGLIFHHQHPAHVLLRGSSMQIVEDETQDRKSTRLNSSHSQISYAVFC